MQWNVTVVYINGDIENYDHLSAEDASQVVLVILTTEDPDVIEDVTISKQP